MKFKVGKPVCCIIILASALFLSSCSLQRKSEADNYSNNIVGTAKKYLGVSYKYGGADPRGFDCSGFTMFVYKKNRIRLPRSTNDQFSSGKRIKIRDANPGDLIFFDINGRGISHVGIYAGNYRFIHAPRTGKNVSYADIRNTYWKKRFRGIVTYQ